MPHIDPRVNELYLALGEFVMKFAEAENQIKIACSLFCQGKNNNIHILVQDMKTRPYIEFIRKCHKHNKLAIDDKLDATLSQFLIISTKRNNILHNGFAPNAEGLRNRKFLLMPFPDQYKEEFLSTEDLIDMTHDLKLIINSLAVIKYSTPAELIGLNERPPSLEWLRSFQLPSPFPWRYK